MFCSNCLLEQLTMKDFETNPYASPACNSETVSYQLDETTFGTWKSFQHKNGKKFREFNSHAQVGGLPLLHFTSGKCPETNRRKTAVGLIAVGAFARGFIAVGQVSSGVIAVGQASFGLLFGVGQLAIGVSALGQLAVGHQALGQFAVDHTRLSQLLYDLLYFLQP